MTGNIILMLLLSVYLIVPIILYKIQGRRMARFCYYMTVSDLWRRFFCCVLLLCVIVMHIVYYNTNGTDWGLMVSTAPMLMMFSMRWTEWFIARLNDNRKEMLVFVILTLLIAWAPHLITLAITFGIITIGVTFYPSKLIRSIDRYLVTTEYCRSVVTGNYSRFINCYFA